MPLDKELFVFRHFVKVFFIPINFIFAFESFNELNSYLKDKNINLYIVVYPWPFELKDSDVIVYTSGLGGLFKPGIPIGKITKEQSEILKGN